MNDRIKNLVDAMEGKIKKGKKYVDPEEYEKLTGNKDEEKEDDEEGEDEEPKPKKGDMLANKKRSLFTIMISMGKKK